MIFIKHTGISSPRFEQFGMCPAFGNFSPLHNANLVSMDDGGQSVCNHQNRLSSQELIQRFLNQVLIFGVGKSRCFIQQNNGRILQNCSCQRYALHFATGKINTFCTDDSVCALWEFFQNIITLRQMKRMEDSLSGGIRCVKGYIIQNRHLEKARVLKYDADLLHPRIIIHIPDIHAADFDGTVLNVPKPGNEICYRTFPAAGFAHQCRYCALFDDKGNIIQRFFRILFIGKGNMRQDDVIA